MTMTSTLKTKLCFPEGGMANGVVGCWIACLLEFHSVSFRGAVCGGAKM